MKKWIWTGVLALTAAALVLVLTQPPVTKAAPAHEDIACIVTVNTATTVQAVGGDCVAPGAGLCIFIGTIKFTANASGLAADAHPTIKSGTGGTCGSNTMTQWSNVSGGIVSTVDNFQPPIRIPANNELCWISTTAGSKGVVITGWVRPC